MEKMKRILKTILGGVLVLVGVVMLVTPGPALVFIPAGLATRKNAEPEDRTWFYRNKVNEAGSSWSFAARTSSISVIPDSVPCPLFAFCKMYFGVQV